MSLFNVNITIKLRNDTDFRAQVCYRIIQYDGNDSVRRKDEISVDHVILNDIAELENSSSDESELDLRYDSENVNDEEKITTHITKHRQELISSSKSIETIENGESHFLTPEASTEGCVLQNDTKKTSNCTASVHQGGSDIKNGSTEQKESHSRFQRDPGASKHETVQPCESTTNDFYVEKTVQSRHSSVSEIKTTIEDVSQDDIKTPPLPPLESKISLERKLSYVEGWDNTAESYWYPKPWIPGLLDASYSRSPVNKTASKKKQSLANKWDDSEGYYRVKIGEVLNFRYKVFENIGRGVYSNVVRANDEMRDDTKVAIKILRKIDVVQLSGLNELKTLKQLNKADPSDKYNCIRLLNNFYHRRHLCLVFESFSMNIRQVLKKYGKKHGIKINAVRSYTQQIFMALKLLYKNNILHADIKPDNILVDESKVFLKLGDFGSAVKVSQCEITPYLASRFYRAPEVILGHPYYYGVDIWATACTIYEMATARILFTGESNNEMLKLHMDLKGKIPNGMVKRSLFRDQHFDSSFNFLHRESDWITKRENIVLMSSIKPSRDLQSELIPDHLLVSAAESYKLLQLNDLLDKMLILEPSKRCNVTHCLAHPFIIEIL